VEHGAGRDWEELEAGLKLEEGVDMFEDKMSQLEIIVSDGAERNRRLTSRAVSSGLSKRPSALDRIVRRAQLETSFASPAFFKLKQKY
jgi:hypothetical protein